MQGRVFTCRLCGNHLASNAELISKACAAPSPSERIHIAAPVFPNSGNHAFVSP